MSPSLLEAIKNDEKLSDMELSRVQRFNRMFIGANFYRKIQDDNYPIEERVEACFFIHKFLDTGTKMYGIELLENQKAFFQDILATKEELMVQLDTRPTTENLMQLQPFEVHPLWKGTADELDAMSLRLHEAAFTYSRDSFKQAFGKNWQEPVGLCMWKDKIRYLMFLLNLLDSTFEVTKEKYFQFISDRFRFSDNKKLEVKNIREAFRGIENKLEIPKSQLQGKYLRLNDIQVQVFATKAK